MWGEADPYHTARFVEALRKGGLRLRIGDGSARFQHCYVGNAAHAHWLAARALAAGVPGVAGEVFFVTDGPARNIFEHMEPVARGLDLPMPPRRPYLPAAPARWLGGLMETAARLLPFEPTLTRSSVRFLTEDLVITSDKARRLLGYEPRYSEEESVARTVAWFRDPAARP
jgi:sterol-4alpha-carboxylate 3-dehydrogenase (decarboxylating)